jgi:hypothetical protein
MIALPTGKTRTDEAIPRFLFKVTTSPGHLLAIA